MSCSSNINCFEVISFSNFSTLATSSSFKSFSSDKCLCNNSWLNFKSLVVFSISTIVAFESFKSLVTWVKSAFISFNFFCKDSISSSLAVISLMYCSFSSNCNLFTNCNLSYNTVWSSYFFSVSSFNCCNSKSLRSLVTLDSLWSVISCSKTFLSSLNSSVNCWICKSLPATTCSMAVFNLKSKVFSNLFLTSLSYDSFDNCNSLILSLCSEIILSCFSLNWDSNLIFSSIKSLYFLVISFNCVFNFSWLALSSAIARVSIDAEAFDLAINSEFNFSTTCNLSRLLSKFRCIVSIWDANLAWSSRNFANSRFFK